MSGDFIATASTIVLTAALSYFLGNRSARLKVLSEQRARATSRFVTLIGETVSVMRGQLAAGQGDDFEQTDQPFNHLEFLARLRAALDLERPYLNARASEAVEMLIRRLRTHSRIRLHLATGGLTPEEASLDASLEGLMTACTDAQKLIVRNG